MTNKRAETYEKIFEYIETHLFKLQPSQFMADFEKGIRKAIQNYFPQAALYGCWYHYCAAIRRRLMNLNMFRLITDDQGGIEVYRMLLSLPLLPKDRLLDGFEVVKRVARDNHLNKDFKKFFEYFDGFWMKLVCIHFESRRSDFF